MIPHLDAVSITVAASRHSGTPISPAAGGGVLIALGLFLTLFMGGLGLIARRVKREPGAPLPGTYAERRSRHAPASLFFMAGSGVVVTIVGIIRIIAG